MWTMLLTYNQINHPTLFVIAQIKIVIHVGVS